MSIPDKHHRIIESLIQKAQPQSLEELQVLLNSLVGAPLPDIPEEERAPEDRALDLVDEAMQASTAKGQKLAEQALEIWPDCLPAYEYLAAKTKSKSQHLAWIEKSVAIGQRLFGGDFLKKNAGHFWGITETRPYMRCLNALANANVEAGKLSKAIVIWEDMLRLNPNDNQGVRYSLLPALLRQNDLKSYSQYRKQHDEDGTLMCFNDALVAFMEKGADASSNKALKSAIQQNRYVIPLLLDKAPPAAALYGYTTSSPEEALVYAREAWPLWRETPGATDWLKTLSGQQESPAAAALPLLQLPHNSLTILLSDPYSPISPLQLRADLPDEAVAQVPFVQLIRAFLSCIQREQPMKLTPKGNLTRVVLRELYDTRLFPYSSIDDGTIKLLSEDNFPMLMTAHALCQVAKLIKKQQGKVSLTKKGLQLLQGPVALLYLELLKTYTQRLNWSYNEGWSYGVDETGQIGWATIMYEFVRQGDTEQSDLVYAKQYFQLFPNIVALYHESAYNPSIESATSDFRRRFFQGFCQIFGLAEIIRKNTDQFGIVNECFIKRTDLCERVFRLG